MFSENSKYDSTGNIVERYNYGAYGELTVIASEAPTLLSPRQRWEREGQARQSSNSQSPVTNHQSPSSSIGNPITYTGQRYDSESGLYYYKNRFYSASLGRFLTKDPLSMIDGPNLYAYVGNDPINWIDSMGTWKAEGHTDLTEKAMRNFGFSAQDIKISVNANLDIDDFTNQLNDPEHYMPGTKKEAERVIHDKLNRAIALEVKGNHKEAMKYLGEFLHTVQDRYAHYEQNAGWAEHIPYFGTEPDNPKKHPLEYANAQKDSIKYVRLFKESVDSTKRLLEKSNEQTAYKSGKCSKEKNEKDEENEEQKVMVYNL